MAFRIKTIPPRHRPCRCYVHLFTGFFDRFDAGITFKPVIHVNRSAAKRVPPVLIVILALFLTISGCIHPQLRQLEKRAAQGENEWIAVQRITCQKATYGCSQRHLIKGNACFQLAQSGREPAANYRLAADELQQGIALRHSWKDGGLRLQIHENLCESLKQVQDLQSGETAVPPPDRFLKAAKALYRLAPESVPAVYYLSKARLGQMVPMIPAINGATRVPICDRLKRTVTRVLSMMEDANSPKLPDWDRFADEYQRLAFDLGSTLQAAGCR